MPDCHQPLCSTEERTVIDIYKQEYLSAASAEDRRQLAQMKILPAIFNYWGQKGLDITDPTPQTKVHACSISIGIDHY